MTNREALALTRVPSVSTREPGHPVLTGKRGACRSKAVRSLVTMGLAALWLVGPPAPMGRAAFKAGRQSSKRGASPWGKSPTVHHEHSDAWVVGNVRWMTGDGRTTRYRETVIPKKPVGAFLVLQRFWPTYFGQHPMVAFLFAGNNPVRTSDGTGQMRMIVSSFRPMKPESGPFGILLGAIPRKYKAVHELTSLGVALERGFGLSWARFALDDQHMLSLFHRTVQDATRVDTTYFNALTNNCCTSVMERVNHELLAGQRARTRLIPGVIPVIGAVIPPLYRDALLRSGVLDRDTSAVDHLLAQPVPTDRESVY